MIALYQVTRGMARKVACPKCSSGDGAECFDNGMPRAGGRNHVERQQAYLEAIAAGTAQAPDPATVTCPECVAVPQQPCIHVGNTLKKRGFHRARIRAARAVLA